MGRDLHSLIEVFASQPVHADVMQHIPLLTTDIGVTDPQAKGLIKGLPFGKESTFPELG